MAPAVGRVNCHAIVNLALLSGVRLRRMIGIGKHAAEIDKMRIAGIIAMLGLVLSLEAHANPDFWKSEGWKTDFSKSAVDFGEIISGGPPRDGIPPIDDPQFVPAGKAEYGPREPVIRLSLGDDVRAYPLSVLIWHEIANDTVARVPVAVTYCPLCDAAIVFERTVDGEVLRFGTTGKLRNSDLVMWDDATESWWQQFSGRAIVGSYTGETLSMLPSRVESFEKFKTAHPDGKVLVPNDGNVRAYGSNPYVGYDEAGWPFLFRGEVPEGVFPLARVVKVGDRAWALDLLRERKRIETENGVVLSWTPGQATALGSRSIAEGADIGNVRVERNGEETIHDVTFMFAFHAFIPDGPIYVQCEDGGSKPKPPVECYE